VLRWEILEQLALQHVLEPESAPDGKEERQRRDYGKQGLVGQGVCLVLEIGAEECAHREVDGLDGVDLEIVTMVCPHTVRAVLPEGYGPVCDS